MTAETAVRHGVEVTRGREDDAWLTVGDQPCDLSGIVGGVERYGNRADAEDAEVRGAPVGIVFRQDGAPVPRLNALALKPYGNAPSHTVELAVCDRLDTVPALDFDSRTITRASDGGGELVEEVAHEQVGAPAS